MIKRTHPRSAAFPVFCLAAALGMASRADALGFNVAVCVNEYPRRPCGVTGFSARLEPLGLESGVSTGEVFTFTDIPPGRYTLTVSPRCNRWGCRPLTEFVVRDQDVFIAVDLVTECTGDCDFNCVVTVDELMIGVRQALGEDTSRSCVAFDATLDGHVSVDELVRAVNRALEGCEPLPSPFCE